MGQLKATEVDAFVAKARTAPDSRHPVLLVYGPDGGLVSERVRSLMAGAVAGSTDPFATLTLEGDDIAGDPRRLIDEARTIALFGGRRAVRVRLGGRAITAAVAPLLDDPPVDCTIVIEAGDLKKSHPLRAAIEKAAGALALPCYGDGERDLARLVDQELAAARLTMSPEARSLALEALGADRALSRNEVQKLVLYMHGQTRIETADVIAVLGDAAEAGLDGVVDAAFAGDTGAVDRALLRALAAQPGSTGAGAVVAALGRQATSLHKGRIAIEAGKTADEALMRLEPPPHFSRRAAVEKALRVWTREALERLMAEIDTATLEIRRRPVLAPALAQRLALAIAMTARRGAGRGR